MNSSSSEEDEDRVCLIRLKAGEEKALDDLMERHGAKLFHYLIRCLQNEEESAELAQETFVRVYQNCGRFNLAQPFSQWLYAIATNLVKDRYRYRSRHRQVSLDAEDPETERTVGENLVDGRSSPSESLELSERAEAVRRAIAALPEEFRIPLVLSEYEERSQIEIAKILGCTAKAVETRLYRARKRLHELLGPLREEG